MCARWLAGACAAATCSLRHFKDERDRESQPCYWESQPTGSAACIIGTLLTSRRCQKLNCAYRHNKPRQVAAAPATQPAPAVIVGGTSFVIQKKHVEPKLVAKHDEAKLRLQLLEQHEKQKQAAAAAAAPKASIESRIQFPAQKSSLTGRLGGRLGGAPVVAAAPAPVSSESEDEIEVRGPESKLQFRRNVAATTVPIAAPALAPAPAPAAEPSKPVAFGVKPLEQLKVLKTEREPRAQPQQNLAQQQQKQQPAPAPAPPARKAPINPIKFEVKPAVAAAEVLRSAQQTGAAAAPCTWPCNALHTRVMSSSGARASPGIARAPPWMHDVSFAAS